MGSMPGPHSFPADRTDIVSYGSKATFATSEGREAFTCFASTQLSTSHPRRPRPRSLVLHSWCQLLRGGWPRLAGPRLPAARTGPPPRPDEVAASLGLCASTQLSTSHPRRPRPRSLVLHSWCQLLRGGWPCLADPRLRAARTGPLP